MKKSDRIVFTTLGIGVATGIGVWLTWPTLPWYFYAGIAIGTLLAIPESVKKAAEQKSAEKILDE